MKEHLLIVEDNLDLLFNLKILLEMNDYHVSIAKNGLDALALLKNENFIPSIIISDIMMPQMDGYEFFKIISEDPKLNFIPFIFLSAKSTPEDVRFGKLLGVDDYLIKPINEEDLLAIIKGKILKSKRTKELSNLIQNEYFKNYDVTLSSRNVDILDYNNCVLFLVSWDEVEGPIIKRSLSPNPNKPDLNLEKLATQLFQSSVSIFGFQDDLSQEGLMIGIKNINKKGYLLFDYYNDKEVRGEKRLFMFGLINNEITYYQSLIIKNLFSQYSEHYKLTRDVDLSSVYSELMKNITTGVI